MSDSIKIPKRSNNKQRSSLGGNASTRTPLNTSSATHIAASSSSSIHNTPGSYEAESPLVRSSADKGKAKAGSESSPFEYGHRRKTSWMSSSLSKSEHTVVNIGAPDGVPRLITCVKASQGFDWNQDIFLPSYILDHDYAGDLLERRQDPVEEIFLTEEEEREMFPVGDL